MGTLSTRLVPKQKKKKRRRKEAGQPKNTTIDHNDDTFEHTGPISDEQQRLFTHYRKEFRDAPVSSDVICDFYERLAELHKNEAIKIIERVKQA